MTKAKVTGCMNPERLVIILHVLFFSSSSVSRYVKIIYRCSFSLIVQHLYRQVETLSPVGSCLIFICMSSRLMCLPPPPNQSCTLSHLFVSFPWIQRQHRAGWAAAWVTLSPTPPHGGIRLTQKSHLKHRNWCSISWELTADKISLSKARSCSEYSHTCFT